MTQTITQETLKSLTDEQLDTFLESAKTEWKERADRTMQRIAGGAARHGIQVGSSITGRRGRRAKK